MAFDKIKYDNEYRDKFLARQEFLLPKDKKQVLKACAEKHGKTVTALIVDALEIQYGLDLSGKQGGE